jgi:ABC-type nitrate/sulfonate/bicarbonate transport system substrate-binding protein
VLESHPDAVTLYVAQSIRAARWARAHRDEARRWVARDLGIAEELVDQVYSPGLYDALEPSLDPHLLDLLAVQKDFLLAEGFIPEDIDLTAWAAHEPLAAASALLTDDAT